jgi:mono/diheme cytochrome c family protein
VTGLVTLVLLGQAQSYISRQSYQPQYQVQFATQAYNQVYNDALTWVAVEQVQSPQQYFGGLVAQEQRAAERQQQAQQATSSTDAKIDRLTALVEQLQRRIDASEPPIPSKPATSAAESPRPSLPALSPVASEAVPLPPTVAQAASVKSAGLALLAQKCAGCHTGTATKGGGHQLFAADGSFAVRDRDLLERIDSAIASGSMPKGKQQQLTLREYVSIRDFLGEQAGSLAINTLNPRKRTR